MGAWTDDDEPPALSKMVKERKGEAKLTGAEVRGPSEGGMPPDFGRACAAAVVAVAASNATDKRAAARTDTGRLGIICTWIRCALCVAGATPASNRVGLFSTYGRVAQLELYLASSWIMDDALRVLLVLRSTACTNGSRSTRYM